MPKGATHKKRRVDHIHKYPICDVTEKTKVPYLCFSGSSRSVFLEFSELSIIWGN